MRKAATRFMGYRVENYKLLCWTVSAMLAGSPARSMCRRWASSIPASSPRQFHRGGDLGGGGRTRDAGGRGPRRFAGHAGKTWFTGLLPEAWLFALGALFVLVTLFLRAACSACGKHRGPPRQALAACRSGGEARGVRTMEPITQSLLYLDNVSVVVRRLPALNALSLTIEEAEMRAIIGPNGAGKTTMMDVITGKTRPTKGEALFAGVYDLTKLDEAAIAQLASAANSRRPPVRHAHGGGQSPPRPEGGPARLRQHLLAPHRAGEGTHRGAAGAHPHDRTSGTARRRELSHGQKQWLEIGMLLAQEPRLLLVDEPAAGMTDQETADHRRIELLRDIAKTQSGGGGGARHAVRARSRREVTVLHEGFRPGRGVPRPGQFQ